MKNEQNENLTAGEIENLPVKLLAKMRNHSSLSESDFTEFCTANFYAGEIKMVCDLLEITQKNITVKEFGKMNGKETASETKALLISLLFQHFLVERIAAQEQEPGSASEEQAGQEQETGSKLKPGEWFETGKQNTILENTEYSGKVIIQNPFLNCEISNATLRTFDLLNAFLPVLEELLKLNGKLVPGKVILGECRKHLKGFELFPNNETFEQEASEFLNDVLFDKLNQFCPDNYYFGSHPGDGACFGFWQSEEQETEEPEETEEQEPFITHGFYTVSNSISYEIQLNNSCDAARAKYVNFDGSGQITDWLEIESEFDEDSQEFIPVIKNVFGSDVPLNEVMRADFIRAADRQQSEEQEPGETEKNSLQQETGSGQTSEEQAGQTSEELLKELDRIKTELETEKQINAGLRADLDRARDKTYNGWKNFETWLADLWFDEDAENYNRLFALAQESFDAAEKSETFTRFENASFDLRDKLKELIESESPLVDETGLYTDLLNSAIGEIDFQYWANHILENESVHTSEDEKPGFEYYINLDERGLFSADVRTAAGETVFEIESAEELAELITDGFLKSGQDLHGLLEYLKELEILPENAKLKAGNF